MITIILIDNSSIFTMLKNSLCSRLRDLGTTRPLTYFLFSSLYPRKMSPEFVRKCVARRQSASELQSFRAPPYKDLSSARVIKIDQWENSIQC